MYKFAYITVEELLTLLNEYRTFQIVVCLKDKGMYKSVVPKIKMFAYFARK